MQIHGWSLSPETQRFLPQRVDNEWIQKLGRCPWKPVDASAAAKMLEDQAKRRSEETNVTEGAEVERSVAYFHADRAWPFLDDPDRAKLLEGIGEVFRGLIQNRCLAASHLNEVIKLAMHEIQGLAAGSQLLIHALDKSPQCICFSGARQLMKILDFLLKLWQAYDSIRDGKRTYPMDGLQNSNEIHEVKDKIDLSEDGTRLLVDERLVTAEITPGATETAAMDEAITPNSINPVLPDTDPFLSWIFSGSSWRDEAVSYELKIKRNILEQPRLVDVYKEQLKDLNKLSQQKDGLTKDGEALQVVHDLCLEEGKKSSCVSVLRKRKDELTIMGKKDVSNSELAAIIKVLQAAEEMNANQSGASDLESQIDSYMEMAIEKEKENLSEELSVSDLKIMLKAEEVEKLKVKLEAICTYDYRGILVPLMKAYLRGTLEYWAEKDAMNNADSPISAELALGSKGVKGGSDGEMWDLKLTDDDDLFDASTPDFLYAAQCDLIKEMKEKAVKEQQARQMYITQEFLRVKEEGEKLKTELEDIEAKMQQDIEKLKGEERGIQAMLLENEDKQKTVIKQMNEKEERIKESMVANEVHQMSCARMLKRLEEARLEIEHNC